MQRTNQRSTGMGELLEPRRVLSSVSFVEEQRVTGHDPIDRVIAADLDGDGDQDVLSSNEATLVWYTNRDGRGDMGQPISIAGDEDQSNLRGALLGVADIDQDRDLDVVWGQLDDIVWFENVDGLGTFGEPRGISEGRRFASSLQMADIDGDRDTDLLIAFGFGDQPLVWYENVDGRGNFEHSHAIDGGADGTHTVVLSDIDLDSDLDLVVTNARENRTVWRENENGRGDFGAERLISDRIVNPAELRAGDLDGDGDQDLVVSSHITFNRGEVLWLENLDGRGTFGSSRLVTELAGSIRLDDMDGDQDPDVILGAGSPGRTATWHENINGGAEFRMHDVDPLGHRSVQSIHVADMDLDGDVDVLTASKDAGSVAWYRNQDGLGDFGAKQPLAARALLIESLFSADLDGDGDRDLISGSTLDQKVAWYENVGQGQFRVESSIDFGHASADAVFAADVDGDGDRDVLSVSSQQSQFRWYENRGGGLRFTAAPRVFATPEPNGLAASDLDGDGDVDVVVVSEEDDDVRWFANLDGRGEFGDEKIVSSNLTGAKALTMADLDGDGDADIVVAAKHSVVWFENQDGRGEFGTAQVVSHDLKYGVDIRAVDVDGDGDLDLVSGAEGDGRRGKGIAWHENMDGRGRFDSPMHISTLGEYAVPIDLDGDGDVDLLSGGGRRVYFHENLNGFVRLSPPQLISRNLLSVSSLVAGDWDEDGDLDFVVADRHLGRIVAYANQIPGDSNLDGRFDSADLIAALLAGEYEDDRSKNSTFREGDWNGDGEFTSADFVFVFQAGCYQA